MFKINQKSKKFRIKTKKKLSLYHRSKNNSPSKMLSLSRKIKVSNLTQKRMEMKIQTRSRREDQKMTSKVETISATIVTRLTFRIPPFILT